jgi:hypothetical protein
MASIYLKHRGIILVKKVKVRDYLGNLEMDWRIMLKVDLREKSDQNVD